ncbi:MAG: nitrate reductase associated protein [Gloeocapsa sp. DLM2.Bin57]|nr:MAG: nitrate reductase associated protein [Gloeocapsa sp. DLM2.Bin57]
MKTEFFNFEADFVDNLRCIPMIVRFKLDTCGVKLKLTHWNNFSGEERQLLVSLPCNNNNEAIAYKNFLQSLIVQKTSTPAAEIAINPKPPWLDANTIPPEVRAKALEFAITISITQWQSLTPLQRFALIKLSRPSHENSNFYPALLEFNLT